MAEVVLDNLRMKRESKSYVDSLHAVLTHAGLFQGSKYALAGYTGMAFKLSVHRRLLHISVTAYGQWGESHRQGIDNLGIFTISDGGRTRHSTFEYYQRDAVNWVKRSLDGGVGVIYWIPEFGVIHGYDDHDRIFYVQDGWSKEPQILLYDNFGLNFTGFWHCQVFGDRVRIPEQQMLLESLRMAIEDWDIPYRLLPDRNIASGRLAYDVWVEALRGGDYDASGTAYILESYCRSRTEIQMYLQDAQGIWTELDQAYACYEQLGALIMQMKACMIQEHNRWIIRADATEELAQVLLEAKALEEQAVDYFRLISLKFPDRKRSTVPRWGAHSAR
ncbi:C39 family peptidase [Paenibacillus pabuli]|uniref:C39 family peptidase n=1 Tax=Paenibacillus pabuli TaxID=1472 RepID=UPI000ACFA367|nr:C39 family peptidase [Paenibacillus pabuli]MEC0125823.1 C39 family peptidase [Paenibacillus pabuli]